jgi:hypothetical protein
VLYKDTLTLLPCIKAYTLIASPVSQNQKPKLSRVRRFTEIFEAKSTSSKVPHTNQDGAIPATSRPFMDNRFTTKWRRAGWPMRRSRSMRRASGAYLPEARGFRMTGLYA